MLKSLMGPNVVYSATNILAESVIKQSVLQWT